MTFKEFEAWCNQRACDGKYKTAGGHRWKWV